MTHAAVDGAKNVLEAAINHKVKRFIFTSDALVMFFGNEDKLIDESMWAD